MALRACCCPSHPLACCCIEKEMIDWPELNAVVRNEGRARDLCTIIVLYHYRQQQQQKTPHAFLFLLRFSPPFFTVRVHRERSSILMFSRSVRSEQQPAIGTCIFMTITDNGDDGLPIARESCGCAAVLTIIIFLVDVFFCSCFLRRIALMR